MIAHDQNEASSSSDHHRLDDRVGLQEQPSTIERSVRRCRRAARRPVDGITLASPLVHPLYLSMRERGGCKRPCGERRMAGATDGRPRVEAGDAQIGSRTSASRRRGAPPDHVERGAARRSAASSTSIVVVEPGRRSGSRWCSGAPTNSDAASRRATRCARWPSRRSISVRAALDEAQIVGVVDDAGRRRCPRNRPAAEDVRAVGDRPASVRSRRRPSPQRAQQVELRRCAARSGASPRWR